MRRRTSAGIAVMAVALSAACSSAEDAASTTASASTATPATSAATAPPSTSVETTPAVDTTVTVAAPTQASAAGTQTVDEQLAEAIERAQVAMRNCYRAAPNPCDQTELEAALVGAQLERARSDEAQAAADGVSIDNPDDLTWTVLDGPTLKGDGEIAVATVCRYDPQVARFANGEIANDDVVYYRQTWHLLPDGTSWRLSDTINEEQMPASEGNPCE